jgi:hypothetical protein
MRTLYISLFLLLPFFSFSQSFDSIEEELIATKPSQHELVLKAKFLLMEAIEKDDKRSIQKYSAYIARIPKLTYNRDLGTEYLMLLWFINSNYDKILNRIITSPSEQNLNNLYFSSDLEIKLLAYIKSNYSYNLSRIILSNLKEDEKQFLKLYLNWQLNSEGNLVDDRNKLNIKFKEANEFIEKHPQSSYTYYVRNFLLRVNERKDWQWGMDFGLGYGMYSGELSEKLTSGINGLIGFEFFYKKWMLNFKLQTTNSEAIDSIRGVDLTLSPGQKANYLDFHFGLGYELLDGEKMSLTPYAGLSLSMLSQRNSRRGEDLPIVYNFSPSFNAGVNYDYYFGVLFPNLNNSLDNYKWLWGFKAGYQVTNLIGFETKGLLHGFTIGLALKSNYKRRVYR